MGQWVKVVINYGEELPTYYTMHVNDCYIVTKLERLALILNEEIPQLLRLKMSCNVLDFPTIPLKSTTFQPWKSLCQNSSLT